MHIIILSVSLYPPILQIIAEIVHVFYKVYNDAIITQ